MTSKINSMLAHFWWAGYKYGRSTHWCNRRFLSLPKSAGGLGKRNIECLNQALLANQAWRIISGQDSMFCKVFKAKLFGREGWYAGVAPTRHNNVSWGVRSIRYGMELILHNIAWKPGINSNLSVWNSCWMNGERPEPDENVMLPENAFLKDLQVKDLRLLDVNWDKGSLCFLFTPESVDKILAIPLCLSQVRDKVYWKHTSNGLYSVKSGYGVAFADYMMIHGRPGKRENTLEITGAELLEGFLVATFD
ncbi:putative mitochondrial protein AtMg00310 [Silene latifolia]|uniref:putative mitochondrial protein AtMg00310 n=1 Tax=Silene latifolia TaxID=37657 RepID=UPI003D77200A